MSDTALTAPSTSDVRTWARTQGHEVGARGRIPASVVEAYNEAHPDAHYLPA